MTPKHVSNPMLDCGDGDLWVILSISKTKEPNFDFIWSQHFLSSSFSLLQSSVLLMAFLVTVIPNVIRSLTSYRGVLECSATFLVIILTPEGTILHGRWIYLSFMNFVNVDFWLILCFSPLKWNFFHFIFHLIYLEKGKLTNSLDDQIIISHTV